MQDREQSDLGFLFVTLALSVSKDLYNIYCLARHQHPNVVAAWLARHQLPNVVATGMGDVLLCILHYT